MNTYNIFKIRRNFNNWGFQKTAIVLHLKLSLWVI